MGDTDSLDRCGLYHRGHEEKKNLMGDLFFSSSSFLRSTKKLKGRSNIFFVVKEHFLKGVQKKFEVGPFFFYFEISNSLRKKVNK